jgi:hypothetical protein
MRHRLIKMLSIIQKIKTVVEVHKLILIKLDSKIIKKYKILHLQQQALKEYKIIKVIKVIF